MDPYQIGQDVRIGINLRGREWESPQGEVKYFNSIQGWKIETENQGINQEMSQQTESQESDDSDLPF